MTTPIGVSHAIPDWRYAHAVRAGAIAELFSLGPRGLRWRQLSIVMAGTWLSFNTYTLMHLSSEWAFGGTTLVGLTLPPLAFLFAAITAIRSFQDRYALALATGLLYAPLITAIRYVGAQSDSYFFRDLFWLRAAGSSLVWAALTMVAFQLALEGRRRWLRMTVALFAVSLLDIYFANGVFQGDWSPFSMASRLSSDWPERLPSDLVWVLGFWLAQTSSGRGDD